MNDRAVRTSLLPFVLFAACTVPHDQVQHASANTPPLPFTPASKSTDITPLPDDWQFHRLVDEMDDGSIIGAVTHAVEHTGGTWAESTTPMLGVRCQENTTEVLMSDVLPARNGLSGDFAMRVRFDDEQPVMQTWNEGMSNKAFFSQNAIAFAKRVARHETVRVEYTNIFGDRTLIKFYVRGLGQHLAHIAESCGWEYSTSK